MMALEAPPTSYDSLPTLSLTERDERLVTSSVTVGRSSTTSSTHAIELCEERSSNLLDYPRLLGGQVLSPPPRGGLAVELSLPLVLLGDVLPRVLLHRPRQLPLVNRYPKGGVDASHLFQGSGTQLLVAHQNLRPLVGVVGFSGAAHVPEVVSRLPLDVGGRILEDP